MTGDFKANPTTHFLKTQITYKIDFYINSSIPQCKLSYFHFLD